MFSHFLDRFWPIYNKFFGRIGEMYSCGCFKDFRSLPKRVITRLRWWQLIYVDNFAIIFVFKWFNKSLSSLSAWFNACKVCVSQQSFYLCWVGSYQIFWSHVELEYHAAFWVLVHTYCTNWSAVLQKFYRNFTWNMHPKSFQKHSN